MSNEEKNQEQTEQPSPKKEKEVTRGDRGELGTATAGLTIWQRWREAHFTRENANNKHNPNKRVYVRNAGPPVSLKAFARTLLKEGDPVAKEWFANKRGAKNQKRSDANIKAAMEARTATKAAKRKKKGEGGGK
jgi:hypothetical protein